MRLSLRVLNGVEQLFQFGFEQGTCIAIRTMAYTLAEASTAHFCAVVIILRRHSSAKQPAAAFEEACDGAHACV
jgi:hypothetical protein